MSNLYVDVTTNNIVGPLTSKFGLAVAKANRNVVYSSLDVTWNQVDFFEVAGGGSAYRDYPVLFGRESLVAQVMIDPPPLNRRAVAHTTSVSGQTVSVYGGSERSLILVLMR